MNSRMEGKLLLQSAMNYGLILDLTKGQNVFFDNHSYYQFIQDWETILLNRAKELKSGRSNN